MIHPDTELRFISAEVGYGVVATAFIPKGTITWVFDKLDREITPAEFDKLEPIYQERMLTYMFRNNKGNYILCWDNEKFVNHSFNSNCLATAYDFEIAIKDIHPGEQLTDDYGYLNILEPFKGTDEGTRRKIVYPNDLLKYSDVWDKQLNKVFNKIPHLNQALRPLISEKLWHEITQISEGKAEMQSILNNYFDENK